MSIARHRRGSGHRLVTAVGSVAVWLFFGSIGSAHEIGTTRVSVLLKADRRYDVRIVTDAAALLEKLESSSGRPKSSTPPVLSQAAFRALDDVFRRRVTVAFDGIAAHSVTTYAISPSAGVSSPAIATVRLVGEMPRGARDFTWVYSWTFASYALTVTSDRRSSSVTQWLEGNQTSAPFALSRPAPTEGVGTAAWRYFSLGFTHIIPNGVDHILFVLGIFLLTGRARSVLWQVSAFTIAHSITLGLSMYNLVAVSSSLVEPLIAASIAYVAIENICLSELKPWRVVLVFAFGLLHGLGFAGALKDLHLVRADFLTALLTFNAGVEAGQFAVIGGAFLLVGWSCESRAWYRRRVVVPASVLIASTAVYWTLQRLTF